MCIRDRATTQLCNIMLKDSAHIQMFEAEWKNRKAKRAGKPEVVPMYDMNDAMGVLTHFVPCEYNSIVAAVSYTHLLTDLAAHSI